ncbi:phosphopyruvate hydratase [Patescibacteria group bacterium]
MINAKKIKRIVAREILDSRGNPTIEVKVILKSGLWAKAAVPSGASTGIHEALELRDGVKSRYNGKGVTKAVKNVNQEINHWLKNTDVTKQQDIDKVMIELDGTENKKRLGANAILGVSLACARAGAKVNAQPLYKYIRKTYNIHYQSFRLPIAMMNILNGGAHANWAADIQEFMIVPRAAKMSKRVQIGAEVFHALGKILKEKKLSSGVGDEGGYAVKFKKNEEAFQLILKAIKKAGYKPYKDVNMAIDAAASEFYHKSTKQYKINNKKISAKKLIELYKEWLKKYKLISIEDGLAEDDWKNWEILTAMLGEKTMMVGDDLFVTNVKRLQQGIDTGVSNSILIKLNQIGSLTETIAAIYLAKTNKYKTIISHRSGETSDTFIADLAVAVNSEYIKTGSLSRSERIAKYNRLMEIEEELS